MPKKPQHFWIDPDALARKGYDMCSERAQWLWFKVMLLLHHSERYGHLTRDGKSVTDEQAARRIGLLVEEWIALRDELLDFGLLKRTADDILYAPELAAQAEWRSKEAKRQKEFQDRERAKKSPSNNGTYNGEYKRSNNGYITEDITPDSRPNFKQPVSFSNEKKTGSSQRAREGPAAAADSPNGKKWQWEELTDEERKMDLDGFVIHLQTENPEKDVPAILKKGKKFCLEKNKDFTFERLKGWVYGETKTISDEDISSVIGEEKAEDWRKLVEECSECDSRGLISSEKGMQKCIHGKK